MQHGVDRPLLQLHIPSVALHSLLICAQRLFRTTGLPFAQSLRSFACIHFLFVLVFFLYFASMPSFAKAATSALAARGLWASPGQGFGIDELRHDIIEAMG